MKTQKIETHTMTLLKPHPSKCQECAVDHLPGMPHDATSFYYQTKFNMENKRGATWADAMAHCADEMKQKWTEILARYHGIDVNSKNVRGNKK